MGLIQRLRERRRNGERGAALVEFAILAPLLFALVFGIVEFAWAFAQNLDVRQGAREGARLAAVDQPSLAAEICSRMDLSSGQTITITTDPASGATVNDEVTVQVSAPLQELTGLFGAILPNALSSSVSIRIEQPPTNWTTGSTTC